MERKCSLKGDKKIVPGRCLTNCYKMSEPLSHEMPSTLPKKRGGKNPHVKIRLTEKIMMVFKRIFFIYLIDIVWGKKGKKNCFFRYKMKTQGTDRKYYRNFHFLIPFYRYILIIILKKKEDEKNLYII